MATFHALVEQWRSETLVFFDGWPGCFVSAPAPEEALAAAPAAVADHLAWLAGHGLPVPADGITGVEVAEHLRPRPGVRGLRFEADVAPPSQAGLEHALEVGALACADLIDLYEHAGPRQRLEATPPGVREVDKSIADQLRHIAALDLTYVATLSDRRTAGADVELPDDPAESLRVSDRHVAATLRDLPASLRSRVFVRDGEEWTVAKVIRRRTGHLFEHFPAFRSRFPGQTRGQG
jgi:hypothetical protein